MRRMKIGTRLIDDKEPTYFIADIGGNHDGCLERAISLIHLAKDAGADAAKFQHFQANTIVSDRGFRMIKSIESHQTKWKKSVYEVYKDASLDLSWTLRLKEECDKVGITFFSSPYSISIIDLLDEFMPAYKIGSGDITYIDIIRHVASKGKPYIMATGASNIGEVYDAVNAGIEVNSNLALMQCNTNYTLDRNNFKHVNLNVLKAYAAMYPDLVLGLSDHTPGHACVLGAVSLGARMIEKHFTDDNTREGPDHLFAMNPKSWREMVERTRELEDALGSSLKNVEKNEKSTVVLQRRSLRAAKNLKREHIIVREDIEALRPCPEDGISPADLNKIIGRQIKSDIVKGDHLKLTDIY